MPHIRRLQLTQFSSERGRLSFEQHEDIIAACRRGRFEDAARTVEENWANIESLLR